MRSQPWTRFVLLMTGVSGVGKTHTIGVAIECDRTIERLSASGVLRLMGRPVDGLTKTSGAENQVVLVRFVRDLDAVRRARTVFDGHAVLETNDGSWPMPLEVVEAMDFAGIALIDEDISSLTVRRRRKGIPSDESTIRRLTGLEEVHSRSIAAQLELPFRKIRSGDGRALAEMLASINRSDLRGGR